MKNEYAPQFDFTTPIGTALWPTIQEPDTRFNPLGVYSCKIILPLKDAEQLIDKIDNLFNANMQFQKDRAGSKWKQLKAAETRPYADEVGDDGNPTGNVVLNARLPAVFMRKDGTRIETRPKLFTRTGAIFTDSALVGNGSKIRLALTARGYKANNDVGVSLRLQAVQIIEMVSRGRSTADAFGFDAMEEQSPDMPEIRNNDTDSDADSY